VIAVMDNDVLYKGGSDGLLSEILISPIPTAQSGASNSGALLGAQPDHTSCWRWMLTLH
jgi:hypothetical protein